MYEKKATIGQEPIRDARALGIPEGTVKTRMRSARKRLSKTLLIEWEEQV